MDKEKLASEFAKAQITLSFLLFDELDSTNTFAKTVELPSVVVALRQTAGRGRGYKSFVSEAGGLYFSIALPHSTFDGMGVAASGKTEKIPLVCGIAVAEALDKGAYVKWQNDVYLCSDGKQGCQKVCGILCESTADRLVIGIGVNVNTKTFPQELRGKATSLSAFHNKKYDMEQTCAKILSAVLQNISDKRYFDGSAFLAERFSQADMLYGRKIKLHLGGKDIEGIASGIDGDGKLKLLCNGVLYTFNCGEIEFATISE